MWFCMLTLFIFMVASAIYLTIQVVHAPIQEDEEDDDE